MNMSRIFAEVEEKPKSTIQILLERTQPPRNEQGKVLVNVLNMPSRSSQRLAGNMDLSACTYIMKKFSHSTNFTNSFIMHVLEKKNAH